MSEAAHMRAALVQLLLAYAKGERNHGFIEREDLDIAVEMARAVLPGEYQRIMAELAAQEGGDDEVDS